MLDVSNGLNSQHLFTNYFIWLVLFTLKKNLNDKFGIQFLTKKDNSIRINESGTVVQKVDSTIVCEDVK